MSVISLSSSPIRLFARSPTAVPSSPNISSGIACNDREGSNRSKYKAARITRDGFATKSFGDCPVLGTKPGAENLPICSPSRLKFKPPSIDPSSKDVLSKSVSPGTADGNISNGIALQFKPKTATNTDRVSTALSDHLPQRPQDNVIRITASDLRKSKKSKSALKVTPSHGRKATARKKDWTPSKDTAGGIDHDSTKASSFPINLTESFGYMSGLTTNVEEARGSSDGIFTKRRRVDFEKTPNLSTDLQQKQPSISVPLNVKSAKHRSKSPVKKVLTITARATSNYLSNSAGDTEETPMMAFLTSTQARQEGADHGVETIQTKAPRQGKKKMAVMKSRLKSPSTVMKSMQGQDIIFASASQLARDESPTLLRDTLEAMKQSEVSPTQAHIPSSQTAPISIASTTPEKAGTSTFRGRRNLWSAADRDEDNALLYFDDVLASRSLPGNEFINKGGLLAMDRTGDPFRDEQPDQSRKCESGWSAGPVRHTESYDVDDILTPIKMPVSHLRQPSSSLYRQSAVSQRAFSTSVMPLAPPPHPMLRQISQCEEDYGVVDCALNVTNNSPVKAACKQPAIPKSVKLPPEMPNYSSMSDSDLKSLLKAYGFKRLRKRENIIAKLEDCWRAKHNITAPNPKEAAMFKAALAAEARARQEADDRQAQQVSHGAFLSAVHDVAARPAPKVAKPKKPRKKTTQKEVKSTPRATSSSRKRKSRKEDVNNQAEIDSSHEGQDAQIDSQGAFGRINSLQVLNELSEDSDIADVDSVESSPVKGTGVRATGGRLALNEKGLQTPAVITPASPQPIILSSPGFEPIDNPTVQTSKSAFGGNSCDLESQILPALLAQKSSYPPAQSPTWHQKMLMYDPIILEDFTAWLNTTGLDNIGEDREIDIITVKTWLESHGICCLWKGGWRGNKARINEAEQ